MPTHSPLHSKRIRPVKTPIPVCAPTRPEPLEEVPRQPGHIRALRARQRAETLADEGAHAWTVMYGVDAEHDEGPEDGGAETGGGEGL